MKEFPKKIHFKSDNTDCTFIEESVIQKTKEILGKYIYENGLHFKGTELYMSLAQIKKLKENNLIECD